MTDQSPLRRKLGAPGDAAATPAPQMDMRRIWRRAVVNGLMRAIQLDLTVEEVTIVEIEGDEVAGLTGVDSLNLYLDGPDGYGVAIFEMEIAMPMIEVQTLGRVLRRCAEPRAMTTTDAAMVADPLDHVLTTQEKLVETVGAASIATGLRYADMVGDPRQMSLTLGDGRLDHVRIALKAGPEGMRSGAVHFVLPRPRIAECARPTPSDDWDARLNARLMGSEVSVVAELARIAIDVERLQNLAVGDLLTLPRRTLGTVRLVTGTGTVLGNARLGKSDNRKAVRIEEPQPLPFVEEDPIDAAPRAVPKSAG